MSKQESFTDDYLRHLRSLADNQEYRNRSCQFITEGSRMLISAISSGATIRSIAYVPSMIHSQKLQGQINRLNQSSKIACHKIEVADYYKISTAQDPEGVITTLDQRWNKLPNNVVGGFWLAVENIQSPGNLGTIIRTAAASGAQGLILLDNSVDPFSPGCVRGSMGAIFSIPIVRTTISSLKIWSDKNEVSLVATTPLRVARYSNVALPRRSVLLMGGERKGLTQSALRACQNFISIPMCRKIDSLNVAVATGIVLFEAKRQFESMIDIKLNAPRVH